MGTVSRVSTFFLRLIRTRVSVRQVWYQTQAIPYVVMGHRFAPCMTIYRMMDATHKYDPTTEDGVYLELELYNSITVAEHGAISFWPSVSLPQRTLLLITIVDLNTQQSTLPWSPDCNLHVGDVAS
jgi:hypothetical protein